MKISIPERDYEYKIGVGTIGYNSAKEIPRVLKGFMGHVDAVICGDGKFDFYPGDKYYSEDGWLDIASDICKDNCEYYPFQYAGRQVDKRQRVLDIAGKAKIDFLIMIDTDDYIHPDYSCNKCWHKFYKNLFTISECVPDRVFYKWVWIPDEKKWSKQGNEFPSQAWRKSTRIHKDPGTMRYCLQSHYMWSDKNVTDDELIKFQLDNRGEPNPKEFLPTITIDGVRDTMDRTLRTKEQIEKGEEWAHMNQHAENSRQFYLISKAKGSPPPPGVKSWDEWENKPHTFDRKTGQRIEIDSM